MKKVILGTLALLVLAAASASAADTATVAVSATVVGNCRFNTGGSVAFTLDPASVADAIGTVTQPQFWCTRGATYTLSDNNGLYFAAGSRRMRHATITTEFIPYTFTYTASGTGLGRTSPITLDIASTVLNANFINALAGAYADTVTLSITP